MAEADRRTYRHGMHTIFDCIYHSYSTLFQEKGVESNVEVVWCF